MSRSGAHARIRTGDLLLTKEMLYRLSYVGAARSDSIGEAHHGFSRETDLLRARDTRFCAKRGVPGGPICAFRAKLSDSL